MNETIVHGPALELGGSQFDASDEVILTGKVFEIGNFPDRSFSIGADEMDRAITEFRPVPNDLEHSRLREVLGNSLGELRKIWRVGDDVIGEVAAPAWLVRLAGNALKVSLAFNAAKKVVGNALTLAPRISDAEVVAAFAERGVRSSERDGGFLEWLRRLIGANRGARNEERGTRNSEEAAASIATRFADSVIRDGKFLPAERDYLLKTFLATLAMDSGAAFSTGAVIEGESCDALRHMVDAKPAHELGREVLSGGHSMLPGDGISEERKLELLGKTDLGREVTKAKTKAR